MTTVSDGNEHVSRIRKRPTATDKWIREAFGDQPFKRLEIPDFIDLYNHFMNSVDRADQIRTYYRRNRREYRTWRPLWNYLFETTICNAALIWMDRGHSTKRKSGHLDFRMMLATELMAHSSSSKHTDPLDGYGVQTNLQSHVVERVDGCGGTHEILLKTGKECKACMAQGRTAYGVWKRKALEELSANSIKFNTDGEKSRRPRAPRTRYGCSVCKIPLCHEGPCWEEHVEKSKC